MEQPLKINNRNENVEIELWDCSGDMKYFKKTKLISNLKKKLNKNIFV